MSIAGTVRRFARDCVEVIPRSGVWDNGRYLRTEERSCEARGNIQPAPRDVLQRLPEGTRTDGARVFFTLAKLTIADPPETMSDLVRFDGVEYEIFAVSPWRQHQRYVLTRHGQ
jgi:hypothetical protein